MKALFTFVAGCVFAAGACACGTCDEDKVAATYDHATAAKAAAARKLMVFCEVAGTRDFARVKATARSARGVDANTVRVSREPAAISFVVDPSKRSPEAVVRAIESRLPRGSRLSIIRVGQPALPSSLARVSTGQ